MLAFVSVLLIGSRSSPILCIRKLRVTTDVGVSEETVRNLMARIERQPVLAIDSRVVESAFERDPAIQSVRFTANLFGRARLTVLGRTPVAKSADASLAIDRTGFVFPESPEHLSALRHIINIKEFAPYLIVSSNPSLAAATALAAKLQVMPEKLAGKIELDPAGRICLILATGPRVVFGSGDRLDEKLARLREAMRIDPALVSLKAVVNVVEPTGPAMIQIED